MEFRKLEKVFIKNLYAPHFNSTTMLRIAFYLFIILFFSCRSESTTVDYEKLSYDFIAFKEFLLPDYMQYRLDYEQLDVYLNEIRKMNVGLLTGSVDSIECLIVPAINIPINKLKDYSGNLFDFLNYGEMAINNSELLIFENDSLRLKFIVKDGLGELRDGISELDFNEYHTKIPKHFFQEIDFYFSLRLTQNTGVFPIPGIVYCKDNQLKIITANGAKINVEELYQTLFRSKEEFDKYITNIVRYSTRMK